MLPLRVLLTGAQGQVGRAVTALCPAGVELCAVTHRELDISDAETVLAQVRQWAPQWIVNAAAYTAVDRAESEPELAEAVNARGPANLARAAQTLPGCRLLQLSTDYVFNGHSRVPYRPSDRPDPASVYGRTKLQGERAVTQLLAERATVLRTAWIYAPQGRNFLLTMLRLMRERGEVRVVADQLGSPSAAESVARAVWAVLQRPEAHGILHWTDLGQISWYDFARSIADTGVSCGLLERAPRVTPISTAEYPTAAARPPYSVLDLQESADRLGLAPRPWEEGVRSALETLAQAATTDPGPGG